MQKKLKVTFIVSLITLVVCIGALAALLLEVFVGGLFDFNYYKDGFADIFGNISVGNLSNSSVINFFVNVGLYFALAVTILIVTLVKKHPRGLLVSGLFILIGVVCTPSSVTDALSNMLIQEKAPVLGETYTIYGLIYSILSTLLTFLTILLLVVELVYLASIKKVAPVVKEVKTKEVVHEENKEATPVKKVPTKKVVKKEAVKKESKEETPAGEKSPEVKKEKAAPAKKESNKKGSSKSTIKKETATATKKAPAKKENKKAAAPKKGKKEPQDRGVRYYISKHRQTNKWQFKKDGSSKAIRLFTRKDEAIKFAREYIQKSPDGGELTIHG